MERKSEKKVSIGSIVFTISVQRSITFIQGDAWELRPDETIYTEEISISSTINNKKIKGNGVRELNPIFRSEKEQLDKGIFGIINNTSVSLRKESYEILKKALEEVKEETMFEEWENHIKEEENKKNKRMISSAKKVVKEAEKEIASNGKLMTEKEILKWNKNYNNVVNEGGSGYIPNHVSIESYEEAKIILGI